MKSSKALRFLKLTTLESANHEKTTFSTIKSNSNPAKNKKGNQISMRKIHEDSIA